MASSPGPSVTGLNALYFVKKKNNLAAYYNVVTDGMVKYLEDEGVLSLSDMDHLNKCKSVGKRDMVEALIGILAGKEDGFPSLIKACRHDEQEGLAQILESDFQRFCDRHASGCGSSSSWTNIGTWVAHTVLGWITWVWVWQIINWLGSSRPIVRGESGLQLVPAGRTKASYLPSEPNRIGKTGNSEVFMGYWDKDVTNRVAIKVVHKSVYHVQPIELKLARDIWGTRTSKTTYIVPVLDISEDHTCYHIVMELAQQSLETAVLSNFGGIRENTRKVVSLLQNCVEGLRWLHEDKKLVHRDIKPQNILIFQYDYEYVAKLADFGICRHDGANTRVDGSDHWMSPEALHVPPDQTFVNTQKMDIFSLGMVFSYCFTGGEHPFQVGDTLVSNIKNLLFLPPALANAGKHFLTAAANELLQGMMQKEPKGRPTIAKVQAHPLFWDEIKCLQFLEDVCSALSNKKSGSKSMEVRLKLDEAFKTLHENRTGQKFDWMPMVEEQLFQRKGPGGKDYESASLISLVELIRDKAAHYQDAVEKLFDCMFNGTSFTKENYACYFLEKFPLIVIFLFDWLVKEGKQYSCLQTLRNEYLPLFTKEEVSCDRD